MFDKIRILSSVVRAFALQAKGPWFDPRRMHQINRSIAQPGSASALGAEGRRFESYYSDQFFRCSIMAL